MFKHRNLNLSVKTHKTFFLSKHRISSVYTVLNKSAEKSHKVIKAIEAFYDRIHRDKFKNSLVIEAVFFADEAEFDKRKLLGLRSVCLILISST